MFSEARIRHTSVNNTVLVYGARHHAALCILFSALCIACTLFFSLCAPNSAHATEPIDTSASCTLTISYTDEGTPLSDVSFFLYKVADVDESAQLSLTQDFTGSGVDISAIDSSSEWQEAAVVLSSYAQTQGIAEVASLATDSDGNALFSDLGVGLYVYVGQSAYANGYQYEASAACVLLPTRATDDTWDYTPVAEVKYYKDPLNEGDTPNTPGTPSSTGGNTTPTSSNTSGTGSSGTGSTGSGNTGTSAASSTLPQTGQTNWPVPVLCAVGFALICAGLFLKRKPYAK